MADSTQLIYLVQRRLDDFVSSRHPILSSISPDLGALTDISRHFLSGGKRFRARFSFWGWRAVQSSPGPNAGPIPAEVISVASALELFHAAALVHDDIMDNSDTRRGLASVHRRFETIHRENQWRGDARGFGMASALLLGDLLLGWSDELLDEGLAQVSDTASGAAARDHFNLMRTQVTVGQYLDIREEQAWANQPEAEQLDSALRVVTYKSAKYSVQAPLIIGASLGGATSGQLDTLSRFGLPLGMAFQLRDDLLGVFGDPAVTGKPSGDDLREGKRTVLIALARQAMTAQQRSRLDRLLGDPALGTGDIQQLQADLQGCGAVDEVELMITDNVTLAEEALVGADLATDALVRLRALTDSATRRSA